MRVQAILAVTLVLAASLFGVCPACEHADLSASTQPMSAPAHECCERTMPHSRTENSTQQPEHSSPARNCPHESANLALQAAAPDSLVTPDLTIAAIPATAPALPAFAHTLNTQETPDIANPSPPPLLVLPIRI